MHTQLAYHANLAHIDDLQRQAADYRAIPRKGRIGRAFDRLNIVRHAAETGAG